MKRISDNKKTYHVDGGLLFDNIILLQGRQRINDVDNENVGRKDDDVHQQTDAHQTPDGFDEEAANVNGDNEINAADIVALINLLKNLQKD